MHELMTSPAEIQRLAALYALEVLDTAPEDRFDHITGLARRIFGVPTAAITFIAADRQWVKSGAGTDSGAQLPRRQAFCHHTIFDHLTYLAEDYGIRLACHGTAENILSRLKNRTIKEVFEYGLHEFLADFIRDNNRLGDEVASGYSFY